MKIILHLKKNIFISILFFSFFIGGSWKKACAQQLPYYSQFKNNSYMLNPAITGTKRELDARLNYRMQWVGYEEAPRTSGLTIHSRFLKGKMGIGGYVMQDNVGPSKQSNYGVSYAAHLKFPDCELSVGAGGVFTNYTLSGKKITLHDTQDPSVDQSINNSTWVKDMNIGLYLYNDRFHIGLGALHILPSTAEFYKTDTTKKGLVRYATHINFTFGYNYSQNPDYIWESTVYANYVKGVPFMLDYTLRVHCRELFFTGVSIRLRDAIAIHLGITILKNIQVSYSYDLLIGKLRNYSSGSHEIMLIYSHNPFDKNKRKKVDKRFLHQRYGYLF